MTPLVFFNGDFCPADSVAIPADDSSFQIGDGIFETLVAYEGEPFAAVRHFVRLSNAAEKFGLEIPDADFLTEKMRGVVAKNGLRHARIRVTISRQSILIAAGPVPDFPETYRLVTVRFLRNENGALAGLKTTSYAENRIALDFAKANGGDEAVFRNNAGNLCEGTASNLFFVKNNIVVTPPLSSGCLPGVTRQIVLDLCEEGGISFRETDVSAQEISEFDEIFITSTLREIRPVTRFDDHKFSVSQTGLTAQLVAAFRSNRVRS